jgi:hypothetical protein
MSVLCSSYCTAVILLLDVQLGVLQIVTVS